MLTFLGGGRGCAGALTRPSTRHLLPKNFEKTALRKRVGIFTVKMRGGHIYGNYCTLFNSLVTLAFQIINIPYNLIKTPEYEFASSLVAGDESEGEVVGIGGGAQAGDGIRFVVSVWSPRPPGGRGGFQGASAAFSVPGATTQPADPLGAAKLDHLFFSNSRIRVTAPPPGSPSVSVPEHEQS